MHQQLFLMLCNVLMTCPSFALAEPAVFLLAFLRRFFAIGVQFLSVVLVDERLFFRVEWFGTVILMLLRAKVVIVITLFTVTFEVARTLKAASHQP